MVSCCYPSDLAEDGEGGVDPDGLALPRALGLGELELLGAGEVQEVDGGPEELPVRPRLLEVDLCFFYFL